MAATFSICQDNGTAIGSPATGTTRSGFGADTHFATTLEWKSADDCTQNSGTAYTSAPVVAGNNSYEVWQYCKFSGTFTQIGSAVTGHLNYWAHTSGAFGTGFTCKGVVTSNYTTPSTLTNAALTVDMTSTTAIASGQTFLLSATGPQAASPTQTSTANPTYSQYLVTQLQTTTSCAAGSLANPIVFTIEYDEA